jgi:hypothetical protein
MSASLVQPEDPAIAERHDSAGHNWPKENCPACIAQRDERPVYRRGDGLTALHS